MLRGNNHEYENCLCIEDRAEELVGEEQSQAKGSYRYYVSNNSHLIAR